MFAKRNKFGKWETLYITKDEENEVREISLKDNLELLKKIKKENPDLSEAETLAIFSTVSKHYHFRAEDYVDWKFITGQSFKKPPKPKIKEKVDTL